MIKIFLSLSWNQSWIYYNGGVWFVWLSRKITDLSVSRLFRVNEGNKNWRSQAWNSFPCFRVEKQSSSTWNCLYFRYNIFKYCLTWQVSPLTELVKFKEPELVPNGGTMLGKALGLLSDCLKTEVKHSDNGQKGDWKPFAFILTDGSPSDISDYQNYAERL